MLKLTLDTNEVIWLADEYYRRDLSHSTDIIDLEKLEHETMKLF